MTQEITQDTIRDLSAAQLDSIDGWIREERKARVNRHKQETLTKIRELARSIDIGLRIEGARGRPAGKRNAFHKAISKDPSSPA